MILLKTVLSKSKIMLWERGAGTSFVGNANTNLGAGTLTREKIVKSISKAKCGNKDCCKRHPKICKWLESRDGCKRNGECDYLHVDKVAVKESQNYKCSGCKDVWGNRECVVEHILSNTRTFFCLNCNDWIKNKISVLEPGWTLLDEAGCLRTEIWILVEEKETKGKENQNHKANVTVMVVKSTALHFPVLTVSDGCSYDYCVTLIILYILLLHL